jgi:hypothetical protein
MLITRVVCNRATKPDNFWKRRRVFKLTAVSSILLGPRINREN